MAFGIGCMVFMSYCILLIIHILSSICMLGKECNTFFVLSLV
jgi:hypothetical protein